jgi:hypothetical protein
MRRYLSSQQSKISRVRLCTLAEKHRKDQKDEQTDWVPLRLEPAYSQQGQDCGCATTACFHSGLKMAIRSIRSSGTSHS